MINSKHVPFLLGGPLLFGPPNAYFLGGPDPPGNRRACSPEIEVIFPRNPVKTKKKALPQFANIFGRKFVGSFSPGWLFFLWSSSAQLAMRGGLNLDGGTRPPASPYNLSTDYAYLSRLEFNIAFSSFAI